jgi:L-fuculose-phosphate aldolase
LDYRKLRKEISDTVRHMSASVPVTATEGNICARTPDGAFLITASGLDYALLAPEDLVLVHLDTNVLDGPFEPSTETPMHAGIYRARPEGGGMVHTHARYSTTLACLGWEIPPVDYMLAVLSDEGRVPVARYATYGTAELARNTAQALGGSHRACLLRNHGTTAVGSSVSEAYSRTEVLEETAEIYYRTRLSGEPIILTPEQMAEVAAKIHDYGQTEPSPARAE